MGNNIPCGIKGIDDVVLNGYTHTMRKVRHVPYLSVNLFSIGVLEEKGFTHIA